MTDRSLPQISQIVDHKEFMVSLKLSNCCPACKKSFLDILQEHVYVSRDYIRNYISEKSRYTRSRQAVQHHTQKLKFYCKPKRIGSQEVFPIGKFTAYMATVTLATPKRAYRKKNQKAGE